MNYRIETKQIADGKYETKTIHRVVMGLEKSKWCGTHLEAMKWAWNMQDKMN